MNSNLYDRLLEYGNSDYYGFHMPGHKRNSSVAKMKNPFMFDITEIKGFDNLHSPEGIIKEEMEKAAKIYGSKGTYFLVNGSSCGNLAAISSVAGAGDKIIIGRNSHKSVYNAVEILKLKVRYLYPEMIEGYDILGGYSIDEVRKIVEENRDAKALVITSPTYEGIVSDIRGICEIAHEFDIPVIVDSAHGAHFILSDKFPQTALMCGADIVIESLHKTLPALTQTAVLHYNSKLVKRKKLEKYLTVFQTSSPSYVLMASICNCINFISEGNDYAEWLTGKISELKKCIQNCSNVEIIGNKIVGKSGVYDFDVSKLVIAIKDNIISGKELKDIFNHTYRLEMEMAAGSYVLAMTSVFDTQEGFERLAKALIEIDKMLENRKYGRSGIAEMLEIKKHGGNEIDEMLEIKKHGGNEIAEMLEIKKHGGNETEEVIGMREHRKNQIKRFIGKDLYSIRNRKVCEIFEVEGFADEIVCEMNYTYLYPPGIPVAVPGEIMSDELRSALEEYKRAGYEVLRS